MYHLRCLCHQFQRVIMAPVKATRTLPKPAQQRQQRQQHGNSTIDKRKHNHHDLEVDEDDEGDEEHQDEEDEDENQDGDEGENEEDDVAVDEDEDDVANEDEEDDVADEEDEDDDDAEEEVGGDEDKGGDEDGNEEGEGNEVESGQITIPRRKRGKKVNATLTPEQLEEFQKRIEKTGVVYLSRIPPFMKPQKVRHLLSRYGEIDRIYLAPEDPKVRAKRKRFGGNRKTSFVEGWVEFKDKKIAKRAASALNSTIMGGKKLNYYHDDIWSIKYLPKFKWHHLTERLALEKATREQKLRAETSRAKREDSFYLENVDKAKVMQHIEERKKIANKSNTKEDLDSVEDSNKRKAEADVAFDNLRRKFKQRKPVLQDSLDPQPSIVTKLFT